MDLEVLHPILRAISRQHMATWFAHDFLSPMPNSEQVTLDASKASRLGDERNRVRQWFSSWSVWWMERLGYPEFFGKKKTMGGPLGATNSEFPICFFGGPRMDQKLMDLMDVRWIFGDQITSQRSTGPIVKTVKGWALSEKSLADGTVGESSLRKMMGPTSTDGSQNQDINQD